jgi:hypothetical protein
MKVLNTVTDAVGLTDYKGADKAGKQAAETAAAGLKLTEEQVQFQREQYADWKAIYGDVQENLGKYYKELTPDRLVSLGLQNQQMEHQAAIKNIQKTFAQKGITTGEQNAVTAGLEFSNAEAKAKIRTSGEEAVNAQKLNFLGVGLNQGTQMLGNINNATSTAANSYSNTANMYQNKFTTITNNNAEMTRQVADNAASAAGYIYQN